MFQPRELEILKMLYDWRGTTIVEFRPNMRVLLYENAALVYKTCGDQTQYKCVANWLVRSCEKINAALEEQCWQPLPYTLPH